MRQLAAVEPGDQHRLYSENLQVHMAASVSRPARVKVTGAGGREERGPATYQMVAVAPVTCLPPLL